MQLLYHILFHDFEKDVVIDQRLLYLYFSYCENHVDLCAICFRDIVITVGGSPFQVVYLVVLFG